MKKKLKKKLKKKIKKKKKKLPTITALKKKADQVFSWYIRRRDVNSKGYTKCVTCGKSDHWRNLQAGHYVSRTCLKLRYDERNVFCQCMPCNIFKKGNYDEYALYLINRFGVERLEGLKKDKVPCSMERCDYQAIIDKYEDNLVDLDIRGNNE